MAFCQEHRCCEHLRLLLSAGRPGLTADPAAAAAAAVPAGKRVTTNTVLQRLTIARLCAHLEQQPSLEQVALAPEAFVGIQDSPVLSFGQEQMVGGPCCLLSRVEHAGIGKGVGQPGLGCGARDQG